VARRVALRLSARQEGGALRLDLMLRPGTDVRGLWLRSPDTATWWPLPAPDVRLLHDRPGAPVLVHAQVDLAEAARTAGGPTGQESTLHLYLDVEHDVATGSPEADDIPLMLVPELTQRPGGRSLARYRLRVG
jgi:hypothetical protein